MDITIISFLVMAGLYLSMRKLITLKLFDCPVWVQNVAEGTALCVSIISVLLAIGAACAYLGCVMSLEQSFLIFPLTYIVSNVGTVIKRHKIS